MIIKKQKLLKKKLQDIVIDVLNQGEKLLFLCDLFIQPILLKSQGMDMVDYLLELVVLILALLLELQLGVEQFVVESLQTQWKLLYLLICPQLSSLQASDLLAQFLDCILVLFCLFGQLGLQLFDGFLGLCGRQSRLLGILLELLLVFIYFFEDDGEVVGEPGLDDLDHVRQLQLLLDDNFCHSNYIL